ncbi:MAG: MmgE/PrpD family protein [Firmicutes bacterium]|nr:MmgE/PrpD family protein [Bacillota bacterium]
MKDSRESITRLSAEFIEGLSYEGLDSGTVEFTKRCIIDWMGCVIGGSSTEQARIIHLFVKELGGNPTSTMIGEFHKTSSLNAALVNGYNCHIYELDDVHKKSIIHPAAPVISAAFSIAEAFNKDGKSLITAIVAGYDIATRIGEAVTPSHYKYWHSTGTCGTFGAAAASAKLLGLKKEQVLHSLGNAGSQAAGLWEFLRDNAMTKYLHCGKAAMNGIISSLLAQKGFTGATRILEGDKGFIKAYSDERDFESSFTDMGKHFKINETVFKPYASCRHTHPSVDCALELKKQNNIHLGDIEEITVETYDTALKIAGNKEFTDARTAKFSLIYCVAAALKFGKLGLREFEDNRLKNPDINKLTKKIRVRASEEITNQYPDKWMARMIIKTKKGEFKATVDYPKGDPENTLTTKEIEDKFMELAALKIPCEKAEIILNRCRNIEDYENLSTFFDGI